MSKNEKDWDKIEQEYLEMKEQDLEQMDMPELWSRIEERLDQSQSEEKTEKDKKPRRKGRKVVVYGTLAAAALLAIVSWSVMHEGNSLKNDSAALMDVCDSVNSESSQSTQSNGVQQSANKENASEKLETEDEYIVQNTEDSASKNSAGKYDVASEEEKERGQESTSDSGTMEETKEKVEPTLLYVEKENGFYEFSVNLGKYDLQLMEISVKKEEDVFSIAYSDFSTSAREVLQEKISDISSYEFYINSEGVLYMKKNDQYYQIQLSGR